MKDLSVIYKKMATLGNNEKVTESEIIENTHDDNLYKNETRDGSYFSVQSEIWEIEEVVISPRIKLKISVFYINQKKEIWTINFQKIKKIWWWEWKEEEKLSLSLKWTVVLKDILWFLCTLDFWSISDRRLSLWNSLEWIEIDENTAKQLRLIFSKEEWVDLIQEIIDTENISKWDIVGVWYKKDQLEIFRKLLDDSNFYNDYKIINSPTSDEWVWQHFFEKNKWIFWYWLNYVWLDNIWEWKLEQVVSGHDFNSSWKRIDWLLSTVSEIKKFVLVEIKKSNTDLIWIQYRWESWTPSKDLYGGISQVQKSINKFKNIYFEKVSLKDKEWNPIESIYNIQPKAFLIIWKLDEFRTEGWINEDKYSSFELYRTNVNWIEIITYDELYERARYIIESIQFNNQWISNSNESSVEDIPF